MHMNILTQNWQLCFDWGSRTKSIQVLKRTPKVGRASQEEQEHEQRFIFVRTKSGERS